MKKILLSTLAFYSIILIATAQNPINENTERWGKKMQGQKNRMSHFSKELNLTNDQKKQTQQFREDFKTKMQELNKNENITVKEQRDRKVMLLKEQKQKFLSILTPEQKAVIEAKKATRNAKRDEMFAKHLNKITTQLNLTPTQVAQLKAQKELMVTKFKAIKEDNSLDRIAKHEKLKSLKTEMKTAREKILSPEQMNKLKEMHKMQSNN